MHDIQSTSLEIFLKEIYPNLTARQRPVLHYLRNAGGSHTNAEIAAALYAPINTVTPRTLELRKLGLVPESGRRKGTVTGECREGVVGEVSGIAAGERRETKGRCKSQSTFMSALPCPDCGADGSPQDGEVYMAQRAAEIGLRMQPIC